MIRENNYREKYNDLREQIRHEDDLINQRIHWLLTSTSILFAVLGLFSGTKKEVWSIISYLIPCMGIFISLFCLIAVISATGNLKILKSCWDCQDKKFLPIMGKPRGLINANLAFYGIPVIIIIAWIIFMILIKRIK